MRVLRFFYLYSFVAVVGLIEVTMNKWEIWEVTEGIIYAVVIPLMIVSLIFIVAFLYERITAGKVTLKGVSSLTGNVTKLIGLLTAGIVVAYFPALIGQWLKPVIGWFSLLLILPALYRLDKIVESD